MTIIIATGYNVFFFKKENIFKLKSVAFLFPVLFFLATFISGYFSKDIEEGLRSVDLYVIPILISLVLINSALTRTVFIKVFNSFFYASVVSTAILLLNAGFKLFNKMDTQDIVFHNFTRLYDQHPIYYAILLSVAIFYISFVKQSQISTWLKRVGAIFLVISLILCASKIVLVVNVVAYLLMFILRVNKPIQKIILGLSFIMLTLAIFNIPFIKERFIDGLRFHDTAINFTPTNNFKDKKLFDYREKTRISDLELRYILWNIGVYHLVNDGKLLFGYGQGDVQDYLDYYYYSYNLAPNWNEGRNIHNQYLHILITNGILLLILFMGYMAFSFYAAIRNKDALYLFFISLIAIVFIFEVVLVRNMGINLFYFLNSFFLIKNIYFENSDPRDERNTKLSWRI